MKNAFRALICFLATLTVACDNSERAERFIIYGQVKNIPSKKVYINNLRTGRIIDSANYDGEKFAFVIDRKGEHKDPFLASLHYKDKNGKARPIFVNVQKSKRNAGNAFMLEDQAVIIDGTLTERGWLQISGGIQNQIKDSLKDFNSFGYMPTSYKNRKGLIAKYKQKIEKFPNSYLLLGNLFNYKEAYSAKELDSFLNCFSSDVKKSESAGLLKEFISLRANASKVIRDLNFEQEDGKQTQINFNDSRIKVLVIWASWCKPCRMEIPKLKEMYKRLNGKVDVYSISIDENKNSWRQAVNFEEMQWTQLVMPGYGNELSKNITIVKSTFNISAIPVVLIMNDEGKVLERLEGYDPETNYVSIIQKF